MRILYVAMKYDYGFPERGLSFEHWNFFHTLESLGHDLLYFDFKTLHKELGHDRMNERLWELATAERPDLLFSVLFQEELDKNVIRRISQETVTTTLNWFADDHWRFDSFSRYWAPCFNWIVTTASSAVPKYEAVGYRNVIKSQWGFNPFLYRRLALPFRYDMTFVGQPHGNRRRTMAALRGAGFDALAWGFGWENGRLDQEAMIRMFNQSRINLNLSNASTTGSARSYPGWVMTGRKRLGQALDRFALGRKARQWRRTRQEATNSTVSYPDQIKARNFEIPGCGGFQLAGQADNLSDYFVPGKEIVVFDSTDDLIEKARYYLGHEEERTAIADAGYRRALRDHTYQRRFEEIFAKIGLG